MGRGDGNGRPPSKYSNNKIIFVGRQPWLAYNFAQKVVASVSCAPLARGFKISRAGGVVLFGTAFIGVIRLKAL